MPWRLFRRIKVAPGVSVNLSKSGLSTSLGPRGAKFTLGHGRVRRTVGLPGTGLFFTKSTRLNDGEGAVATVEPAKGRSRLGCLGWSIGAVVLLALIGSVTGIGKPSATEGSPSPGAHGIGGLQSGLPASGSPPPSSPGPSIAGAEPSTEPPPTTRPDVLAIKIAKAPGRVSRNDYATLKIKTKARARCSIDVEYSSGSSTASGLGDKSASSSGAVGWSWRIGSNTTKGSWPIFITCTLKGVSGQATSSVIVRS